MPITIPSFEGTYCHGIVACATVKTKSAKALRVLRETEFPLLSAYTSGEMTCWVLVVLGGAGEKRGGNHFHLEISPIKEMLGSNLPPPVANEILQKHVSIFINKKIEVAVTGKFGLMLDELPKTSLIRPRPLRRSYKDALFTVDEMAFDVKSAIINRISWELFESDFLAIELFTRLSGTIDSEYIVDIMQLMETAFRAYVLGEDSNAHREAARG